MSGSGAGGSCWIQEAAAGCRRQELDSEGRSWIQEQKHNHKAGAGDSPSVLTSLLACPIPTDSMRPPRLSYNPLSPWPVAGGQVQKSTHFLATLLHCTLHCTLYSIAHCTVLYTVLHTALHNAHYTATAHCTLLHILHCTVARRWLKAQLPSA